MRKADEAPSVGGLYRIAETLDGVPHPYAGLTVTVLETFPQRDDLSDCRALIHEPLEAVARSLRSAGDERSALQVLEDDRAVVESFQAELELLPVDEPERRCPSCGKVASGVQVRPGGLLVFRHSGWAEGGLGCTWEVPA